MSESRKKGQLPEDLQALFDAVPPTEAVVDKVRKSTVAAEKDPAFVSESLKAQFVEDVLEAMEMQELNRSDLATRLGMSRQQLGRMLNERGNVTLDTIARVACALELRVSLRLHDSGKRVRLENAPVSRQTPVSRATARKRLTTRSHAAKG